MTPTLPIAFLDSIGGGEILMIAIVVLLLFGPRRLPEIARLIGRTSAYFQKAVQDFKDQLMQAGEEPPPDPEDADAPAPLPEEYADTRTQPHPRADPSGPPEGRDRPEPPRAG
jgi:sec-independent protein translocase protein TatA